MPVPIHLRNLKSATLLLILTLAMTQFAVAQSEKKTPENLLAARKGFKTKLIKTRVDKEEFEKPPAKYFSIVKYKTDIGEMAAYLTVPKEPKVKKPAIIWVTGGFPSGGAGRSLWQRADRSNDQTARSYMQKGMIMMWPGFRGNFGNPGKQETLLGEVYDLLAAYDYLKKQDFVNPEQIYLGGHSTGGTLVLLAACTGRPFSGVISFGPVANPTGYGQDAVVFDVKDEQEARMRSPIHYLNAVRCPVLIIEGSSLGNASSLEKLKKAAGANKHFQFITVNYGNHYDVLAPLNDLLATRLMDPKIPVAEKLKLTAAEAQKTCEADWTQEREVDNLYKLANFRAEGIDFSKPRPCKFAIYSRYGEEDLVGIHAILKQNKFEVSKIVEKTNRGGGSYHIFFATKIIDLNDLKAVNAATLMVKRQCRIAEVRFGGWNIAAN